MSIYRRKGTKILWYRFTVAFEEYRGSTGETDRRLAEKVERRRRAEIEALPRSVKRNTRGLVDVAALDLERARAEGAAPISVQGYGGHWSHLMRLFGADTHPKTITPRSLIQYAATRTDEGARGQTTRRELSTLKRGLKLARREGWIPYVIDEWPRIKSSPPLESQTGKMHPPGIVAAWFRELPDGCRDEVLFCMLTGLRWKELQRVKPDWVVPAPPGSAAPGILRMPIPGTKGRYTRDVGLSRDALLIVKRCIERGLKEGGTLFGPGDRRTSRIRARLAIGYNKNITLRDLRHMYGSKAVEGGSDLTAVMRAMGHKSLAMAERYQHTSTHRAALVGDVVTKLITGTVLSAQPEQHTENINNTNVIDALLEDGTRSNYPSADNHLDVTHRNYSQSGPSSSGVLQPNRRPSRHTQAAQQARPRGATKGRSGRKKGV